MSGTLPRDEAVRFPLEPREVLCATSDAKVRFGSALERAASWRPVRFLRRGVAALRFDAFHALCETHQGYTLVWRRMAVHKRRWWRSWLWTRELAPDFEPLSRPRCLGTGEDPRLFRFRGRRYVLSYDWYRKQLDTHYFLHDLDSDARVPLRIEGEPFQGKNWVPFEYDGALHLLYALEPLGILRCDVESGRCCWVHHDAPEQIAELSWKDPAGRIGTRRGGTPGRRVGGSLVLGFGHDTVCGTPQASHHVPFLWVLDMEGPRIRFFEPEHPNPEGLVDPTSWYVRGSDVVVLTTRSEGSWCYPQRFESRFEVVPGGLGALAERTGLSLAVSPA